LAGNQLFFKAEKAAVAAQINGEQRARPAQGWTADRVGRLSLILDERM
jgi:hypothetical protein